MFVPLDEASVLAAISEARALGAEAVAVCLLWSIVNPDHELRVGELIESEWPGTPFTLSHRLNPIIREYRRASSTAIDASLKPLMQSYLRTLESDLREAGLQGHIFVATSFGGAWRPEQVVERPIYSVGSGPSMAPVAALAYAGAEAGESRREAASTDLIVCDTGGTTFDVVPRLRRGDHVRGRDLAGRTLDRSHHRHPGGRRQVDRRGRRLDRLDRPGRIAPGRATERRRGSGPGVLRPRRHATHDHRCRGRARLDRPRLLPRRQVAARCGCRPRRHRGSGRGAARNGRPRGGVRGADDRVREHRRSDPGDHDHAGNRPARGHAGRGRGRLRPEHRPDRARARLPARPRAVDGERPLGVRRALRRRRLRVPAEPLRGDPLARPRGGERDAPGRRRARGRLSRRARRAARAGDAKGLLGRGSVSRTGVGARRAGPPAARVGRGRACGRGGVPRHARADLRRPRARPVPGMPALEGAGDRRAREAGRFARESCRPNRATPHRRTRRTSRRPGSGPFPGTTENPCRSAPGSKARRSSGNRPRRSSSTRGRRRSSRGSATTSSSSRPAAGRIGRAAPCGSSPDELLRPRDARRHRQSTRLDRARDGEHAPAHGPLRRSEHGPRFLLRADHGRQPPARVGRGPARCT